MFLGLSRWDTLMFVEKAIKELLPKEISVKGADGHLRIQKQEFLFSR